MPFLSPTSSQFTFEFMYLVLLLNPNLACWPLSFSLCSVRLITDGLRFISFECDFLLSRQLVPFRCSWPLKLSHEASCSSWESLDHLHHSLQLWTSRWNFRSVLLQVTAACRLTSGFFSVKTRVEFHMFRTTRLRNDAPKQIVFSQLLSFRCDATFLIPWNDQRYLVNNVELSLRSLLICFACACSC